MIEDDETGNGLVYKLIDRVTGEVVSKLSREALMTLSADPAYTAGAVIDTKA